MIFSVWELLQLSVSSLEFSHFLLQLFNQLFSLILCCFLLLFDHLQQLRLTSLNQSSENRDIVVLVRLGKTELYEVFYSIISTSTTRWETIKNNVHIFYGFESLKVHLFRAFYLLGLLYSILDHHLDFCLCLFQLSPRTINLSFSDFLDLWQFGSIYTDFICLNIFRYLCCISHPLIFTLLFYRNNVVSFVSHFNVDGTEKCPVISAE